MALTVSLMLEFLIRGRAGVNVLIKPTDRDGLWLSAQESMPGAQLKLAIRQTIENEGWQVTAVREFMVLVEPQDQTRQVWKWPYMFHASEKTNRVGIRRDGLVPRSGGNTWMNRTCDPPRIYLAADLYAAFEYLDAVCESRPRPINVGPQFIPKSRKDFDIWRVRLPSGIDLYRDVLFPSRAFWTPTAIPQENISLFRKWRAREEECRKMRVQGNL